MSFVQSTSPPTVSQAQAEDITWGVDLSALLSGVQTPTSVAVTLTDPFGAAVTLPDAASTTGNVVSQRVRANALTYRRSGSSNTYTLNITFTPSGTSNVLISQLLINVPF